MRLGYYIEQLGKRGCEDRRTSLTPTTMTPGATVGFSQLYRWRDLQFATGATSVLSSH